jgi:hypothetical protein
VGRTKEFYKKEIDIKNQIKLDYLALFSFKGKNWG